MLNNTAVPSGAVIGKVLVVVTARKAEAMINNASGHRSDDTTGTTLAYPGRKPIMLYKPIPCRYDHSVAQTGRVFS